MLSATAQVLPCPDGNYFATHYSQALMPLLEQLERNEQLQTAADILVEAYRCQRQVFACGNGGSSSNASHFVEDLVTLMGRDGQRLRAMALTDATPLILALANDCGFEHIFSKQLGFYSSTGDVLLCISGSGNSANVLQAARYAKAHKLTVIGLLGYDGGQLLAMCDCAVHVPCHNMGLLEAVHLLILDYWCKHVRFMSLGVPHPQR